MGILASKISGSLEQASQIRRMFEIGIELKQRLGDENVFDFSLGNPDLPPPGKVINAIRAFADDAEKPMGMGYMPNAGYQETREALATHLSCEQGVETPAANVVATCGAAGALNTVFRAILDRGEVVVCPAPYFVEYGFYVGNHGGILRSVKSKPLSFELDIDAMRDAITPKTRAVLLNSPNNPTGQIISKAELDELAGHMRRQAAATRRPIYLISDEPYRFLNYDGIEIPSVFNAYEHSVVLGSFSKSLSIAGERVGYAAVNPAMKNAGQLMNGLILANRILGYVNAPAIGQKIVTAAIGETVDLDIYRQRRDAMATALKNAGIEFSMPRGAFYFFPKSPIPDDIAFVAALAEENILAVPGSGFGYPGFFRLAFCVDVDIINRSAAAFKRVMDKLR